MSFFPAGFDCRADLVGVLHLANVNTPDGDYGFLLGEDGRFTDTTGKVWVGSRLLDVPAQEMSINGTAPAGSITMNYFRDPDRADDPLMAQVQALGADYVRGRPITFLVQPLFAQSDLWQPQVAPLPLARLTMQSIRFGINGPVQRSLTLTYEGVYAGRNEARGWFYTTEDHAKLLGGVANPSLRFAPQDNRQPEKLF
ncbi:hypothetical protein [Paragemmobacter ruber]|uniref:Uncharacterized protein n=1 Tax=Paragemmobacter ruber TaxID=1985673 RepID=A0ABW9Y098_9RHOB|nr:hypothetical protein [Rhodobacter ruber]NBE05925.1 hypothetical protein [Rhodobacter ruber]